MKKVIYLLPVMLFLFNSLTAQNCKYGQCTKIKNNGEQCQNCTGYLESYCSNHKGLNGSPNLFDNSKKEPTNPSYNLFDTRDDCKYSQCIQTKSNGKRCRNCTSSNNEIYCNDHK